MSTSLKILFTFMMTLALSFGFMHLFFTGIDFQRLHIFLYNLCTGGTILLYYTEQKQKLTFRIFIFFILSLIYAVTAFFDIHIVGIFLGIIMAGIVETIRIEKFSFFPFDFFKSSVPTYKKFHHAALLCLSLGLLICSFAIWNENYIHLLNFKKLTLNTFFLGFSFPLSLISLSVAFNKMKDASNKQYKMLKITSFWVISLGVVIFFVFILFESTILELLISITLFIFVSLVLFMFIKLGIKEQRKAFLSSGLSFLLLTSITGVLYISLYFFKGDYYPIQKIILHYHAMLALYGWNLSGLAVICRFDDFPIMLNETKAVILHWVIVAVIAPLGYYFKTFAIIAVILYFIFLIIIFFTKGKSSNEVRV